MADYHRPSQAKVTALKDVANRIRVLSVKATTAAGSGHPTSCASQAEIMSVLFFNTMRYSVEKPKDPSSDRFILSKGHAAPALYAAWCEAGLFSESDLMRLRKIDSDLEGHPTPRLNFIDVATGSLGQGLSVSAGMAYCGKYFDKADYRVYCLMGDGESAEGSVWEALAFASHYKLDNLVAIIDVNRLGQSQPTSLGHDMDVYAARCTAFGCHTQVVDGHDVEALAKAFHEASTIKGKPTAILAQTFKGKGFPDIEDQMNWHGKALGAKAEASLATVESLISNNGDHGIVPLAPETSVASVNIKDMRLSEPPKYDIGAKVAARAAYGTALLKLGRANDRVVAVDADVKNSTFSDKFRAEFPERFIECFIAEQNMVGVGVGVACRDRAVVFASTFAAFFSRAADQIRMAAVSMSNLNMCGSHVGVSIGEDGPSQMALEDMAMFRSIQGSTVFYPSDAVSMERAVEIAANTPGLCFIRSSRPATPVIYANDEKFEIGKAKVVRSSDSDQAVIVAAGVTLMEATIAADVLKESGMNVCIVDPFTVKPMDAATIRTAANKSGGNVIVVEDHYPEGGLGDAVASALVGTPLNNYRHLCVRELPRSGPSAALLKKYGISSDHIVKAVQSFSAQQAAQ